MLARLSLFVALASAALLLYATPTPGLTASTPPKLTAPAEARRPNMNNRALACTECHGKQGVSTPSGYFPRIAGKPAGYLLNQLRQFKSGTRQFEGMNQLLASLPDDYLRLFAEHFAALDLPYPAPESQRLTTKEAERGFGLVSQGDQVLQVPACASCHGERLTGVMPSVPGLLGLPRDYLTAQLGAWKNNLRNAHAPDCMATIARRLSVQDITAVAGWLAAQPAPADSRPLSQHEHRQAVPDPPLNCGTNSEETGTPAQSDRARLGKTASPPPPLGQITPILQQGQYLSRLGNCAACHQHSPQALNGITPNYGGGVAIETPFGKVFGSNISADRSVGIGAWSTEQFYRAMSQGIDASDTALNPVFPYQFFAGIHRTDSDALFAWLKASEPIAKPNRPHELRFPFGTQIALSAWRWLYVEGTPDPQTNHGLPVIFAPTDTVSASVERGRYLVETLMHCNACHAKRNLLGGFTHEARTGGQKLPGNAGYAPSLAADIEAGMANWSLKEIEAFLLTGHNRHADANGLMARVIQDSTQYLTVVDAASAALYLKAGFANQSTEAPVRQDKPAAQTPVLSASPVSIVALPLWEQNCADCHATDGTGKDDLGPALAGRRSVQVADPSNLILSILRGGFGPATRPRPYPPGMPGFAHRLSDQQIATLATMIRQSWGNQGSRVRAVEVQRLR